MPADHPTPPTPLSEAASGPAATKNQWAWTLLFIAPGLLLFLTTTSVFIDNVDRTAPEWIVWILTIVVFAANAGIVAVPRVRRALMARRVGLLLSAIATLVSLAVAEVGLQWWMVPSPISTEGAIYQRDDLLGYTHLPSSELHHVLPRVFDVRYHIDEHGLRRATDAPPIDGTTPRILALGCSMTFGHGVDDDDAWPARLEHELGGDYRVLNAGVAAYGPQQMLMRGRVLAAEFQPEIILVGIASFHRDRFGSDPSFNWRIGNFGFRVPVLGRTDDGSIGAVDYLPEEVPDRDDLTVLHNRHNTPPPDFEIQLYTLAKRFAVGNAMAFIRWLRGETVPVVDFNDSDEANWRLVMEGFGELESESGARVVVLLIPEPLERHKGSRARFVEVVREAGDDHDVEVWDTDKPVTDLVGWRSLMLHPAYELHFNPRATAAMAKVIVGRLREPSPAR